MTTRRNLLTHALTLSGLAASAPALAAQCPSLPIDRKAFNRYIELFSAADTAFTQFYAPDVVLSIEGAAPPPAPGNAAAPAQMSPPPMKGPDAIVRTYQMMWTNMREKIEVKFFVADADHIAVELLGAFICVKDLDDPRMFGRPIKKGEVRRQQGIVLYDLENGKFKNIRALAPRQVHDWRMENI